MALEGFLQEFGLADILQLIYFQKKTGVLLIEGKDNRIKVTIVNGNITGLESENRVEEEKLGRILVKKGLLTPEALQSALEIQKQENARLANILYKKGLVPKEILIETIQHQITDTLSLVLTWNEGRYEFIPQEKAPSELPVTIDTQHLLMDSLKSVDEWSVVEGRLSLDTVFKQERVPEKDEIDDVEAAVLNLVDGESDASMIINISPLGDLETSKALISLNEKGIIAPVRRPQREEVQVVEAPSRRNIVIGLVFVAIIFILFFTFFGQIDVFKAFKKNRAVSKIEQLKNKIDIYRVTHGRYPESLDLITDEKDPWGMPFIYERTEDGFRLFSSGPDRIKGTEDDIY
jgi:hypothetical protein